MTDIQNATKLVKKETRFGQFLCDEQTGKFEVRFTIEGAVTEDITAEDLEDAKSKAQSRMDAIENGDDAVEFDDIFDIRMRVDPKPPLYLVMRDGRAMRVGVVRDGDEPREALAGRF